MQLVKSTNINFALNADVERNWYDTIFSLRIQALSGLVDTIPSSHKLLRAVNIKWHLQAPSRYVDFFE